MSPSFQLSPDVTLTESFSLSEAALPPLKHFRVNRRCCLDPSGSTPLPWSSKDPLCHPPGGKETKLANACGRRYSPGVRLGCCQSNPDPRLLAGALGCWGCRSLRSPLVGQEQVWATQLGEHGCEFSKAAHSGSERTSRLGQLATRPETPREGAAAASLSGGPGGAAFEAAPRGRSRIL